MKRVLSLLLLCLPLLGQAQQRFSGVVVDADTRETLPFVNIIINQQQYLATSDIDGKFSIDFQGEIQKIVFSYVGYKNLELTPDALKKQNNVIRLQAASTMLREVVVRDQGNPAHIIIKKVVANKALNNPERIPNFRYESYNKLYGTLSGSAKDSSRVISKGEKEISDFFADKHLFMSENVTERSYIAPNHSQEVVKANRFSGLKNPSFAAVATDFQPFSFYQNYLRLLDKEYLNPISKGTTTQYDFNIEDTLYQQRDTIFIVSFQPLPKKNFNGLKGLLYINTNRYAVEYVIAESASTQEEMVSFKIQQKYQFLEGKHWFPSQLDAEYRFNNSGNASTGENLVIINRSYIRAVDFDTPLRRRNFSEVTFNIPQEASRRDSSFWKLARPDTLDDKEQRTFAFMDSVAQENNIEGLVKFAEVASFGRFQLFKIFDVPFRRLISGNRFEGLRVGAGLYTNPRLSKHFTLGGYFAYGTRDKAWKYGGSLELPLYRARDLQLELVYQNDVTEPGRSRFPGSADWFNDQVREVLTSRMDAQELWRAGLRFRPFRYTQLHLGLQQQTRRTLYEYSFENNEGLPLNTFGFTSLKAGLTYAHKERFVQVGERKRQIDAAFPSFALQYERGLEGLRQGDFAYDKLEAKFIHEFHIRKVGKSYVQLTGGLVEGAELPYPLLLHPLASLDRNIALVVENSFQTMGLYEFTLDRYAALFYKHNFGALFFRGKRFRPEFIVLHNMAWGTLQNAVPHQGIELRNLEEGFFESGLQIDKILRFKYLDTAYYSFGAGAYYRYGAYRFDEAFDNWVFKISMQFSL